MCRVLHPSEYIYIRVYIYIPRNLYFLLVKSIKLEPSCWVQGASATQWHHCAALGGDHQGPDQRAVVHLAHGCPRNEWLWRLWLQNFGQKLEVKLRFSKDDIDDVSFENYPTNQGVRRQRSAFDHRFLGIHHPTASQHQWENGHIPSGKRLHNYGKSPFLMGKYTINSNFQ